MWHILGFARPTTVWPRPPCLRTRNLRSAPSSAMSLHSIGAGAHCLLRHRTVVPASRTRPAAWVQSAGTVQSGTSPACDLFCSNSLSFRLELWSLGTRLCASAKCAFSSAWTRRWRETLRIVYDVELADRIRAVEHGEPRLAGRRMFGGVAFLIQGSMAVSASSQGGLRLHVDPAGAESLISEP